MKIKLPLRTLALSAAMCALVAPTFGANKKKGKGAGVTKVLPRNEEDDPSKNTTFLPGSMSVSTDVSMLSSGDKGSSQGNIIQDPSQDKPIPEFVVPKDAPTISKGVLIFRPSIFNDPNEYRKIEELDIDDLFKRGDVDDRQKRQTIEKMLIYALSFFKAGKKILKENQALKTELSVTLAHSEENKKLTDELKELQKQRQENKKLTDELKELQKQLGDEQAKLKTARDQSELFQKNKKLTDELTELQKQLGDEQAKLKTARDASKLFQENEKLNNTINAHAKKIAELEKEEFQLDEKCKGLSETIKQYISNFHQDNTYNSFLMAWKGPFPGEEKIKKIEQLEQVIGKFEASLAALKALQDKVAKEALENKKES